MLLLMKRLFIIITLLITLSIGTSCLDSKIEDASVKLVTAEEMESILELEGVQLVDVRTPK